MKRYQTEDPTGLLYFGARYYDPSIGRFTSVDPASAFSPADFLQDPQQLNLYAYGRNNPYKYVDPSGAYIISTGEVERGDTLSSITQQLNSFYGTSYSYNDIAKINSITNPNVLHAGNIVRIGTIGADGTIWQPPEDPDVVGADYVNELSELERSILHIHRNFYLGPAPTFQEVQNEELWKNYGYTATHNIGISGNVDYRGQGTRAGDQFIFDQNGNLVTSPDNVGTYDFAPPGYSKSEIDNHIDIDVAPWVRWGNSTRDPTTAAQRFNSLDAYSKSRIR